MQWGAKIQFLKDMAEETGKTPPALANRPVLPDDLALYWQAFTDLSSSRSAGFGGPGLIPWTAIDAWAARHGVTGETFDMMAECIRRMDVVWIDAVTAKNRA